MKKNNISIIIQKMKIGLFSMPLILLTSVINVSGQNVGEWINKLSNNDWKIRNEAAIKLGYLKDTSAVKPLISALKDSNVNIRTNSALALGRIGDKRALEPLIAELKTENKFWAAEALGEIGDKRAVEPLKLLLTANKHTDRWVAATSLEKLLWKPETDYQKAIFLLAQDNSDASINANELIKMGRKIIEPLVFALLNYDDIEMPAYVLGEIKDTSAVKPLINALIKYKNSIYIIEALGEIGDKRSAKSLSNVFIDSSSTVKAKAKAISIVGDLGDTIAVIPLINKLIDNSGIIRSKAAEALGKLNDKRALIPLINSLKDDDYNVREKAAEALGKLNDKRALIPLINSLKDDDYNVREKAAEALGKVGDTIAIEPLIMILNDKYRQVRYKVADALDLFKWKPKNINQKTFYLIAHRKDDELKLIGSAAIEPLIYALKNYDEQGRSDAAGALINIVDSRAIIPLISALHDSDDVVRANAAIALGNIKDTIAVMPLISLLKSNDYYSKEAAAKALGNFDDKRAITYLINLLTDWQFSMEAANSLAKLKWKPQTLVDSIHFFVAKNNGLLLKQLWNKTKQILLKDMISTDYSVMQNALYAFISLGKQEIIPELIQILNEKGNKTLAESFLNCGNQSLASAAKLWASKNGYNIVSIGGSSPVSWGAW